MYIEKALSRLKFEKVPLLVVAIALGHRDGEWKSGLESSPGAFLPYPEIPEEVKGRTVENDEEGCISVCSGAGPCHAQNPRLADIATDMQIHVTRFTCTCK